MIKRTSLHFIYVVAVLVLIAFGASVAQAGQKVEIKTENGVTIVHNPKTPVPLPGGPSKLVLKEELVIGKESGASGPFFADLRSLGVDDKENVWTLDWSDIKIRVFDKTGKLISTFGKKGQGPKELQGPQRMAVSGDGRAFILDRNKLAVYGLDGSCLEELSTAKISPFRIKLDKAGFIYLDSRGGLGPKGISNSLTKFDAHLNPVMTISTHEQPLPVSGTVSPFPDIVYFVPTSDGHLIWGVGLEYQFHVLDHAGKLVKMILKDFAPLRISIEDQKTVIEEMYGNQAPPVKFVFPDAYPPFQFFMGDDEDRLYVRTYEKDGQGGFWHDVFDAQGRCFTRFSLPKDEMLFIVKKSKLYVMISENEEGIPLIKRYGMEWK